MKPLLGRPGRCVGASSSRGSRCSVPAGTVLGSQGPEQKRLSEGSRLAWISKMAAGETGLISRQAGNLTSKDLCSCQGWRVVRGHWLCAGKMGEAPGSS